ncbi:hypothetical protein [Halapricum salinum]|uniref:Uncharacterized protein n=1 Tax=Halapricum salinum TaxID=1457250 RepID=A0A4D6HGV2_9EURY|nr:hypothetical protein [Halapricum salinum]QCC52466.1 hypothetical protein DV733_15040 [Halapricum salinum]
MAKLLLGAVGGVFVLWLFTLLPGVGRSIPGTAVSIALVLRAVATILAAGLLVYAAFGVATLVATSVDRSREFAGHVASIAFWLVALAAVLVTHWGLAPLAAIVFDGFAWVYDTVFLLLALGPLVVIAARIYAAIDPAAGLFADKLAGERKHDS